MKDTKKATKSESSATANVRYGKGITGETKNGVLHLQIPLNGDYGYSSTGKTLTVATTGGFQDVDGADGVRLSVNVCKKPSKS